MRIAADSPTLPQVEPFAASFSDPNHLASAVMVVEEANRWKLAVSRSEDGGATWTSSILPGQEGYDIAGDPWLAWTPGGTLYLSHIGIASWGAGEQPDWRVLVHRSLDGGRTWERRGEVPGAAGFDHPVLFAGMREGGPVPLYLAAVVDSRLVLVRSDDDGGSYEAVERFAPERGNIHLGAAVASPPGVIALSYANLRGSGIGVPMRVGIIVSQDEGRTWSSPIPLGEGVFTGQPMMTADPAHGRIGADGHVEVEGTRSVADPRLWLIGYGEWTGFASATLIGVGRTARATVREIEAMLGAR